MQNPVKGLDAVELPVGTRLRVISNTDGGDNVGDVIMRTSDRANPFVSLTPDAGILWGWAVYNYTFEVVNEDAAAP